MVDIVVLDKDSRNSYDYVIQVTQQKCNSTYYIIDTKNKLSFY